ncbi:MAG: bifunctional phosphopantothenoylcysteine decarboxylase/phosphopantothenate--cysteine ligase CoaBC [Bacteroidetes bacterium]|jgi:phosphopantothenoylcysteine decarboxylase/phosphopantothenate--cysteine ligase|nr:bifunctional phosphopantothenoylcysteine decarboxylase/phosphopantothenate--cysteine ligase CoaBC [Bacteroidota bacterium]
MANLQGKRIILGITGSIAAYKAAMLTRLFIKAGAEVQVLMTPGSTQFISPLTLSTLSKRPVYTQVTSEESWNSHVELGLWADAMVVAPLTANTLAKMAHGICDNIITATYLSARCPVFFAPAMDLDMWTHPSTAENVERLRLFGNYLIEVGTGELASGLVGAGRMAEPEAIVSTLGRYFRKADTLHGRRILITAGPTHEPIDPVRFIGNHSTGKMGIALAEEAAARGAQVHLVLGPSALATQHPRIELQRVQTAGEMHEAALSVFPGCDAAIFSAAVADYRPAQPAEQKIKKSAEALSLDLVKNPDIAADLGQRKTAGQYTVGFALETQDAEANALRKLERKNMDLIVLNTLEDEGAGFQHDTNKVSLLRKDNKKRSFELKPKREVAADILDELQELAAWKKDGL